MKRKFRLLEKDMKNSKHFPVIAMFNMVRDTDFIKTLGWICVGQGFGLDYGACTFPNDQDEYDIITMGKLEGVEFGLHNGDEVVIDYATLYYYLKKVCEDYTDDYPNDKNVVNELLAKYRALYNIAK